MLVSWDEPQLCSSASPLYITSLPLLNDSKLFARHPNTDFWQNGRDTTWKRPCRFEGIN
jgi:hypothetical protein